MKVKFNNPDEFIEEMEKDGQRISRNIVRLTTMRRISEKISALHFVSVIATYRVGDEIIELDAYCGNEWTNKADDKVWNKVKEIYDKIQKACERLNLEVRAGFYEKT